MSVDVRSMSIDTDRSQLASFTPSIVHRKLAEPDIGALRVLHQHLFPIDYDASFYNGAVQGDGILGIAAVLTQTAENTNLNERFPDATTVFVGNEQFVGFITAREFKIHEIPPTDRQLLGFSAAHHDNETVMYILTLGVAESFRKQGIARSLLARVEAHAANSGCSALYLHVITYNNAAAQFYKHAGFSLVTELKDFYYIKTGRALDPDVCNYDAYVFKKDVSFDFESKNSNFGYMATIAATAKTGHSLKNSSSPSSHLSLYSLWEQFTKVCLPFGGSSYKKRKERYYQTQGKKEIVISNSTGAASGSGGGGGGSSTGGAPSWLRGLFASISPPADDSAHTA